MRKPLFALFFVALFTSCDIYRTHTGKGFGGEFGYGEKLDLPTLLPDTARSLDIGSINPGYFFLNPEDSARAVNKDTGFVASTGLWSKDPVYVDSLPPDSLRNEADKQLAKAVDYIHKANKWEKKRWFVMLGYLAIALPLSIIGTYLLVTTWGGIGFFEIVFLVLILATIWSLFMILLFSILAIPSIMEGSADQAIRRSVKHAPDNRKLEYLVRSLFMLQDRMSVKRLEKQIVAAEEMAQTEEEKALVATLGRLRALYPAKKRAQRRNMIWALAIVLAYILLSVF